MKPIVSIPFTKDKSYDFYEDKLVIGEDVVPFETITGFSYLLTRTQNSVSLVPVHNTYSFTVSLARDNGQKTYKFSRQAGSAFFMHSNKQRTVEDIYRDVVQCIDTLIAPVVFEKTVALLRSQGEVQIGSIHITPTEIYKKRLFGGKKVMPVNEYAGCTAKNGFIFVKNSRGKTFATCQFSKINAALLPPLLDKLFGKAA